MRVLERAVLAAGAMVVLGSARASAQKPSVFLPPAEMRRIAADFDEGRNPLYCFFGRRETEPELAVDVDSVRRVDSITECDGVGLAFVTRISDRAFLTNTMRGLMDQTPSFLIVSAFYGTIDHAYIDGPPARAPQAFSIVRGIHATTIKASLGRAGAGLDDATP